MSNHVNHLLAQWLPLKNKHKWVLGFIFKTEGSCYRKAGAMMLFSDAGHQLGILSGGCLESDIVKKAQRVMTTGSRTAATMTKMKKTSRLNLVLDAAVWCT